MNRRRFLRVSALCAAAFQSGYLTANSSSGKALAGHRIAAVEARAVPLHWPRHVGKNAKIGLHGRGPTITALILKSDEGAVGWGEFGANAAALDTLRPQLIGKPVADLIDPAQGIQSAGLKALDIALHDLAAVILGVPVWKMLGAAQPHLFPVYSGMIYFDDLHPDDKPAGIDQVLKNCAADRDYGYRQLKVKIGRGHKWMPAEAGLRRDIEVVHAIARAFPECELLVDGNDGFAPDTFIEFLKGIEGIPLVWIEEPFVENEASWRKIHDWTRAYGRASTLLADGEANNDYPLLEKLEAAGVLQVRLCDIVGYGFTPWRVLMPRLKMTKTLASPHAWGSGLKTVYAAHLAGGLGNCATIEGVTCSHEHIDFGENVIRNGKFQLSSKPGFGLALRGGT